MKGIAKFITLTAVMAGILMSVSGSVSAQLTPPEQSLEIMAGSSIPIGDFNDYWNPLFNVGIEYFFDPYAYENLEIGFRYSYNHFSSDWEDSIQLTYTELMPTIKYYFSEKLDGSAFFLQGGFGFSLWKSKLDGRTGGDGNDTQICVGLGFEKMLNDAYSISIKPLFHRVFREDSDSISYVSISLGLIL